jgi:hypothetical protein
MRATAGFFSGLAAMASVALAAPPSDQSPIYLRGYYKLYDNYPIWHSLRHYCLIDHEAPTGSHIREWTFTCGDPATVEVLYNTRRRPLGLLYGVP